MKQTILTGVLKGFGILLAALLLLVFLVALPLAAVKVYDSVFRVQIRTSPENALTAAHYDGLTVENVSFSAKQGHTLAGYKYRMEDVSDPLGVLVVAHGFGGGGHCGYMPLIAWFADHGYLVFGYDATANDNSEGEAVGGFPQGVMDLDYAIRYVKSDETYAGLPIYLMGHSWGAYSVGNVLNFQPDVAGAVMFAGFDYTTQILRQQGEEYVGDLVRLMLPYAKAYEFLKFGKYTAVSTTGGIQKSDAHVMIVHSTDDDTVHYDTGFEPLYAKHHDNPRVHFVSYTDRGHNYLYYPPETMQYRASLAPEYHQFLADHGLTDNDDYRAAFRDYVDWDACYGLDEELMGKILAMFEEAAQ